MARLTSVTPGLKQNRIISKVGGLAEDRKRNHILNDTEQHPALGGGQRWDARLTDLEPVCQINSEIQ